MLKRIILILSLALGLSLSVATASFASTTDHQPPGQSDGNWQDHGNVCRHAYTPGIVNLGYVENTQQMRVTVTLFGDYYWVQVKDPGGHITYLGPQTKVVILFPGQSISVAWHKNTGDHSWCWTGRMCFERPPTCPEGWTWVWTSRDGWAWQEDEGHCVPCPVPPVVVTTPDPSVPCLPGVDGGPAFV